MPIHTLLRALGALALVLLFGACATPRETPGPGVTQTPSSTPTTVQPGATTVTATPTPSPTTPAPTPTRSQAQVTGKLAAPPKDLPSQRFDVVVVGGTSAGVGAALAAAKLGATVVIVEETPTLGGMMSNGLSVTDIGTAAEVSGFFEDFRARVQRYYQAKHPNDPLMREDELSQRGLKYEPHVADRTIKEMVAGFPSITVLYGHILDHPVGQESTVTGVVVRELKTGKRRVLQAPVTVDATLEGDVAALAGAPFRVGREPRSPEEPHAGVIYFDRRNPTAYLNDPRSTGEGDHRVQAYSYLLTLKEYPRGEDRTIPRPEGYDPSRYACPGGDASRDWPAVFWRIPNGKMEINVHPYGSDLPGANYDYPTAPYERRLEVRRVYLAHALGFLYHLQTMCGMRHLDLAEDEYTDNGHVPYYMYVREARRIEGEYLFTERDASGSTERPHRGPIQRTGIAVGAYPMDSHAVRSYEGWSTRGEGEFFLQDLTKPYQVPYGVLVPKQIDGILVAVAVSATHVGYGALRMEPVRWQMGEAAGTAAVLAGRRGVSPRNLDVDLLQQALLTINHQLYMYAYPRPDHWAWKGVQWLATRGALQADAPPYTLSVDAMITRAQGAEMLAAALGLLGPAPSGQVPISNTPPGMPAADPVKLLAERGIIAPDSSGSFNPEQSLTRQEAALWAVRAYGLKAPDGAPSGAMQVLEANGLKFNPKGNASSLPGSPVPLSEWADLLYQAAVKGLPAS